MKAYCTQNNGDCETCSLVNYDRDCMNNPVKNYCKICGDRIDSKHNPDRICDICEEGMDEELDKLYE